MNSIHSRYVTDPDKDEVFVEVVNEVLQVPIATLERNDKNDFSLFFFPVASEVNANEFINLLQNAIEQLKLSS